MGYSHVGQQRSFSHLDGHGVHRICIVVLAINCLGTCTCGCYHVIVLNNIMGPFLFGFCVY